MNLIPPRKLRAILEAMRGNLAQLAPQTPRPELLAAALGRPPNTPATDILNALVRIGAAVTEHTTDQSSHDQRVAHTAWGHVLETAEQLHLAPDDGATLAARSNRKATGQLAEKVRAGLRTTLPRGR